MPPFSIPAGFFDQLRRDLRALSGIPSYDSSVPDLLPYQSCIAGVDPSPPHLRCNNCEGRLLRGVDSAFCVFCGEERFGDAMPDPLNFRDTKGYAWLLEALGLDGSESFVPISAEDEWYRRKNKVKRDIHLSDLLNLEIKWSVLEEKPATGSEGESARPKGFLNLGGVELDNIFSEGTAEAAKEEEADKGSRVFESNIVQAPDNLSSFGNVPPSSTAGNSTEYESGNPMSAWKAEFQFVETAEKTSLSADPFAGSSVEISAFMDEMFGPGNARKGDEVKPSSGTENWSDEDPRGDSREDIFPGASSKSVKPVNVSSMQSEASASDSVINMESKEGSEEVVKQDDSNATSRESDQLQILMSQMHDLPFMLDSNPSSPPLSGNPHAFEK